MLYLQCEGGSNICKNWYRMICSDYATRKLSYESDRLPDSSRLASVMAAQGCGVYCAGIWWKDVAFRICWYDLTFVSLRCYDLANTWRRRGYGHQFLAELSFSKELPQPITLCYLWRAGKLPVLWHCRYSQWRPTRPTA